MNKVSTANRRGFLKKSLYSAPVVLALGHLTPSMVYGADRVVLSTQAVTVTGETSNPVPSAASGSGSGNTGSGVTGSSTDGGGGSNGAGGANGAPATTSDNNITK